MDWNTAYAIDEIVGNVVSPLNGARYILIYTNNRHPPYPR